MVKTRFIRAPRPGTLAMLYRRIPRDMRREIEGKSFDAVGLVQSDLPGLFYFADVAQKAAAVIAVELLGTCPQHVSTIAFFGTTSAVTAALAAVAKVREKE
ncbi:MAG TPA: BMC domain-containing protein [Firmicutes bacterium]|jgi:hypothetical protein|nr:BMC domain-containing protein [Bacillota bacterium]